MPSYFDQFRRAESSEQCEAVCAHIRQGGFSVFREFLEEFQEMLKRYEDADKQSVGELLSRARRRFPDPGRISPAWQTVWDDFEEIVKYKNIALETVPPAERAGEWQIVLDNPYVHQQVVCYPGLSFIEAAYLYGYFHPGLQKNEYIRLQKIQTLLYDHGRAADLSDAP